MSVARPGGHASTAPLIALMLMCLYCGFRLNEATGTTAVVLREPQSVAEPLVRTLSLGRAMPVTALVTSTTLALIGAIVAARRRGRSVHLELIALGCFAIDLIVTFGIHLPMIRAIQAGPILDWTRLRSAHAFDDWFRTVVLAAGILPLARAILR